MRTAAWPIPSAWSKAFDFAADRQYLAHTGKQRTRHVSPEQDDLLEECANPFDKVLGELTIT